MQINGTILNMKVLLQQSSAPLRSEYARNDTYYSPLDRTICLLLMLPFHQSFQANWLWRPKRWLLASANIINGRQ